jgi:hypothetical protein
MRTTVPALEQQSLIPATDAQLVRADDSNSAVTLLSVIAAAARDPQVDVAKMTALLNLKERIDAKQAEIAFNADFAAAKLEMPRVGKHGVIDMGTKGKMPFALYEDLDSVIRPIEARHGFARTFSTEASDQAGIKMTCRIIHRGGHSICSTRFMPPDPGPGRNAMQAIGSASSYAKRYLTLDIWDIVTIGADDNGRAVGFIDEAQYSSIIDMIAACEMNAESTKKFCAFMEVASVREINKADFEKAMNKLRDKRRLMQGSR